MKTSILKKKSMLPLIVLLCLGTILYGHKKGHDWLLSHHGNAAVKDHSGNHEISVIRSDKIAYRSELLAGLQMNGSFDSICSGTIYSPKIICTGDSVTLTANTSQTYNWLPKTHILAGTDQTANAVVYPLVTTTYTVSGIRETGNLITNGSFEKGNVEFYSDYVYDSYPTSGKYYITDNPNDVYFDFSHCSAVDGDSMMLVNGEEFTPGEEVWYDTINTLTSIGDSFYFSFYATSVYSGSPAVLKVYVEGDTTPKQLLGTLSLTADTCRWDLFEKGFTLSHNNKYLRISLVDSNMNGSGNDFALDNFWFSGFCTYEDAVMVYVRNCDPCIIAISDDTIKCREDTIILNADSGYKYRWTPNNYIVSGTDTTANPVIYNQLPTTYHVNGFKLKNNLLSNGNFEAGFTGFYSDYDTNGQNINEGQYYVTDSAHKVNQIFSQCGTKSGTKMMVVNGAQIKDHEVWYDTIFTQVFPVDHFYFSFWGSSVFPDTPAVLRVYVEEENFPKRILGTLSLLPDTACVWQQFEDTFYTASISDWLRISIVDTNTSSVGNDFALDSIWLSSSCAFEDSVFVNVIDCDTCYIDAGPDTVKCAQDTLTLQASGGVIYDWNPFYYILPGTETTANPKVFNSVPTYFSVSGYKLKDNLLSNGSFEAGNIDFHTDYNHTQPVSEGDYFITDNSNKAFPLFSYCQAKSGDSMMVVNGSRYVGDEVWYDTSFVLTIPGDPFYFSFWGTSVKTDTPAVLRVFIKEQNSPQKFLGLLSLTPDTCEWQQFSDTFFATSTSNWIRISIEDKNTKWNGNDFALDSFWFSRMCSFEDTVFVGIKNCAGCQYSIFETIIPYDTSDVQIVEECRSIKYTKDCGFIVAANTFEPITLKERMELIKLDNTGLVSWNKRYQFDNEHSENLHNVEQTTDSGFITCGWMRDDNDPYIGKNCFVLKTDKNGMPEWALNSFLKFDDELFDIEQIYDSGYIVTGYVDNQLFSSPYPGNTVVVMRFDSVGVTQWAYAYSNGGHNYDCEGYSIEAVDEDGDSIAAEGFILTGYLDDRMTNNQKDVFVMRLEDDGNVRWTKTLSNKILNQEGRSIKQIGYPGEFVLTGYSELRNLGGAIHKDVIFIEFDEYHPMNKITTYYIGTPDNMEEGYAIETLQDTSYVIAGEVTFDSGNRDALLLEIGYYGSLVWTNSYGDSIYDDWARSVEVNFDTTRIAFAGATTQFHPSPINDLDYYVLNSDSVGWTPCVHRIFLDTLRDIDTLWDFPLDLEDVDIEYIEVYEQVLFPIQVYCYSPFSPKKYGNEKQPYYEESDDGNLKVYPVPVGDSKQLNFDYKAVDEGMIDVWVIDLLGNVVLEGRYHVIEGINQHKLDLNKLSSGTYFLRVSGKQGEYTSKIMIAQ